MTKTGLLNFKVNSEIFAATETCHGDWVYHDSYHLCRCEPISIGGTWTCTGCWSWTVCSVK